MTLTLRRAEAELMEMLEYARIEGAGAVLRPQECESIRECLDVVRNAQ